MLPPPAEVRKRWAAHNPGLDTSPMEVVALVKQINSLVGTAVEPLYDGASLTAPELDLLIPLRYASGPVIARRLADQLQLSRAGISKTLAKLEGRGFIERAPNPADRRAALVTVTPAGAEAVDALFPRQLAVERELLAGLGEGRAKVLEALNLLIRVMEGHLTTASGSRP